MIPGVTQEQFLGAVRAVLTCVGGVLIARGAADISTIETITGIVITVSGMIWSFASKRDPASPPSPTPPPPSPPDSKQ